MSFVQAKPTVYNGVQYKSRLEARFAEWMDQYKADFEYEPGCIGSERYAPDFVIKGAKEQNPFFIEVKPICFASEAWSAINAVVDYGASLLVVDSPQRLRWGTYAAVLDGKIRLFTDVADFMPEIGWFQEKQRPAVLGCSPFLAED